MLHDLCDISGYGIHSGIHPGPKADKAANYILQKLRLGGLTNAGLDQVKVNDAFLFPASALGRPKATI
jgi:hypothetical protein